MLFQVPFKGAILPLPDDTKIESNNGTIKKYVGQLQYHAI